MTRRRVGGGPAFSDYMAPSPQIRTLPPDPSPEDTKPRPK